MSDGSISTEGPSSPPPPPPQGGGGGGGGDVGSGNWSGGADYGYDYDYYYLEDPATVFDEEALTELCHALVFSGFFMFLFALAVLSAAAFLAVLWRRRIREGALLTAVDVFTALVLICGIIKLSPKVWQSLLLHGHAAPLPSQSGCKLAAFTTVGMSHVITYLLCGILLLARAAVYSSNGAGFSQIDSRVRRGFPWILLGLFAFEGVTGMAPAIYMDLGTNGKECNATQSMPLTAEAFVGGHILLFSLLPYLVPLALCTWPAIRLYSSTASTHSGGHSSDDQLWVYTRTQARTVLFLFLSYALAYSPVAIITLSVFPALMNGNNIDMVTACHFEGAFRILEDLWFPFAAILVILRDPDLGKGLGGKAKQAAQSLWGQVSRRGGVGGGGGGGGATYAEGSNMGHVALE